MAGWTGVRSSLDRPGSTQLAITQSSAWDSPEKGRTGYGATVEQNSHGSIPSLIIMKTMIGCVLKEKGGLRYGLLASLVDPIVTRGVTTQVECNSLT